MKRKNGFTLVELLAVITILAIIALIAVPKVTEVIEDSEKKTIKNSASNLIKTVDMYLIQTKKDYGVVDVLDSDLVYNGEKPEYGVVEINQNGQSRMYAYKDGYCITKTYTGEIEVEESTKEDCSGFVDALCKAVTELSTQFVSGQGNIQTGVLASEAGRYAYGVEYTCDVGDGERTFYVLEESEDNVSLILNTNLGRTVAWCKSGSDNLCAADGAIEYLEEQTSEWLKNLDTSQISLPSAEQIATAGGDKVWTDDNYTETILSSSWLYENLNVNDSVPYAYWTSTPDVSDSYIAWFVYYDSTLNYGDAGNGYYYGVRPVITISKSELK